MEMNTDFRFEFIPTENMDVILPLVNILNNFEVPMETLESRLKEMLLTGYQCLGVYDGEKLIGICGVWVLNKLYVGKHMELDNVFVLPQYRSQGVGRLMLDRILEHAVDIGCETSEINCYIKNEKGVQFWEDQGYKAIGYHMQKVL